MIFELVIKSFTQLDPAIKKLENDLSLSLNSTEIEICLTNKSKNVDNLKLAKKLYSKMPNLKVRSVYSIRVHGCRSKNLAIQLWDKYLLESYKHNHKDILVVSGVPTPVQFSSIEALFYARKYLDYNFNFGVAFNPFFNLEEEYIKLKKKFASNVVSEVFFQLGDNYLLLKKGLSYVSKYYPTAKKYVSILKPSPTVLTKFKIMPWHGVLFSDKFLASVESAALINDKLVKIAKEYDAGIYLCGL